MVVAEIGTGLLTEGVKIAIIRAAQAVRSGLSPTQPALPGPEQARALRACLVEAWDLADVAGTDADWMKAYLLGPAFPVLLEHMIVLSIAGRSPESAPSQQRELSLALLQLGAPPSDASRVAQCLQPSLARYVDDLVQEAFSSDLPEVPFEAILESYLRNIQNVLTALDRSTSLPDAAAVQHFRQAYERAARAVHGYVTPQNFEAAKRVPLADLFVQPHLESADASSPPVAKDQWLQEHRCGVILGDPGGGKSTFLQALLVERIDEGFLTFHVTLREYQSFRARSPVSIVEWIGLQLRDRYQVGGADANLLEWLLTTGQACVVFDGLDELLEVGDRRRMVEAVDAFCQSYPLVSVLVSSRRVGYEEAPLAPDVFGVAVLARFVEDQVQEYVQKFFSLDVSLLRSDRERLVASFLRESALVADLRVNPLLLGLMCNIYRAEGYIPKNRPDVYDKCARMLFERWDRSRGIQVSLPFEEHLVPAMRHLAYWVYSDAGLQTGVTEDDLIQQVQGFLLGRRFDDPDAARAAARSFVEFCRGRAWVLTDTGSGTEQPLFQFTHRTFLEYFTAQFLNSQYVSMAKLLPKLLPRIRRAEWDVIGLLAVHVQCRREDAGADLALRYLRKRAETASRSARRNILLFASRLLESVVPPPAQAKMLAHEVLALHLEEGGEVPAGRQAAIAPLLGCSDENRAPVLEAFDSYIEAQQEPSESIVSLVVHLSALSPRPEHWREAETSYREQLQGRLTGLAAERPWAAIHNFYNGVSLRSSILEVDPAWLLESPQIPATTLRYVAPATRLVQAVVNGVPEESDAARWANELLELADWLDEQPRMVEMAVSATAGPTLELATGEKLAVPMVLDRRAELAAAVLLAALLDAPGRRVRTADPAEAWAGLSWMRPLLTGARSRSPIQLPDESRTARALEEWSRGTRRFTARRRILNAGD